MIVLDTHIWIWWVHGDQALPASKKRILDAALPGGLGVSAISCWEVAKLAAGHRITLPSPTLKWIDQALNLSGVRLLGLTPEICVEATVLPGTFHRDPADQIIVATARTLNVPLLTLDAKILAYPHVLHA